MEGPFPAFAEICISVSSIMSVAPSALDHKQRRSPWMPYFYGLCTVMHAFIWASPLDRLEE